MCYSIQELFFCLALKTLDHNKQLPIQLEEAAKLCQAECAAQKARKEAERRKVAEEEEKKKRILEYFQQL